MRLRKLELKDAPRMLEWMHDPGVVAHMGTNFGDKTMRDCEAFITGSLGDGEDLHLAVVNGEDEYMGTVSLKHIDRTQGTAEFAITVRADAMGRGFSRFGMEAILEIGIRCLGLTAIYWCVSPENSRAVHFYDKCGYQCNGEVPAGIMERYPEDVPLIWYRYTG